MDVESQCIPKRQRAHIPHVFHASTMAHMSARTALPEITAVQPVVLVCEGSTNGAEAPNTFTLALLLQEDAPSPDSDAPAFAVLPLCAHAFVHADITSAQTSTPNALVLKRNPVGTTQGGKSLPRASPSSTVPSLQGIRSPKLFGLLELGWVAAQSASLAHPSSPSLPRPCSPFCSSLRACFGGSTSNAWGGALIPVQLGVDKDDRSQGPDTQSTVTSLRSLPVGRRSRNHRGTECAAPTLLAKSFVPVIRKNQWNSAALDFALCGVPVLIETHSKGL